MSDTFGSELVADLTKEMEANDSRTVDQRVHDAIVKSDPIEIHPDAELFPLMVDCEDGSSGFASLIADIKLNHVNEPLVVDNKGRLVDGRNRYAAIKQLIAEGHQPTFNVKVLSKSAEHIKGWVMSTNLHRRHLSTSQRAVIAASLVTATKSSGGKRDSQHVTTADAAKTMAVSPRQVKKAAAVTREAQKQDKPEVVAQVKAGKKTINKADTDLKKGKPAPAVKKQAPSTPAKKSALRLTEAQDSKVLELLAQASSVQLTGYMASIRGLLKVANK